MQQFIIQEEIYTWLSANGKHFKNDFVKMMLPIHCILSLQRETMFFIKTQQGTHPNQYLENLILLAVIITNRESEH